MEDPTSGDYGYTDIDMRGLRLSQAEVDAYLAMT